MSVIEAAAAGLAAGAGFAAVNSVFDYGIGFINARKLEAKRQEAIQKVSQALIEAQGMEQQKAAKSLRPKSRAKAPEPEAVEMPGMYL